MRVLAQLQFLLSQDDAQTQKLSELLLTLDNNDVTLAEVATKILAPSATNQAVSFGQVTRAQAVLVVAFQEITVKLEGTGSPAIPVRPLPANTDADPVSMYQKADQPGFFFWYGRVTSIHLGNPSTTVPATVFVALVGDAAA